VRIAFVGLATLVTLGSLVQCIWSYAHRCLLKRAYPNRCLNLRLDKKKRRILLEVLSKMEFVRIAFLRYSNSFELLSICLEKRLSKSIDKTNEL